MITSAPPDRSGVRFPPPLVYAGLFLVGCGIHYLWPAVLIPGDPAWLRPLGWILIGAGLAFALTAAVTFQRAGTPVNPYKPVIRIVAHGPFRLTRNPMYVSLATLFLGGTALVNSLWLLLLFPPTIVIVTTTIILPEEAYLERKFGDLYLDYKKKVRRWL